MITVEYVASLEEKDIPEAARKLDATDIAALAGWLGVDDDRLRYRSLLLLEERSALHGDVYPYFNEFAARLKSGNSYQRNIGIILLAKNARWDAENRLDGALNDYLALLYDEKPITARYCARYAADIAAHKPALRGRIAESLMAFDILSVRETMRKLLLMDILMTLIEIHKAEPSGSIMGFVQNALTGGILGAKEKKLVAAKLA